MTDQHNGRPACGCTTASARSDHHHRFPRGGRVDADSATFQWLLTRLAWAAGCVRSRKPPPGRVHRADWLPVELLIARNPDPDSSLPCLLRLPLGAGLVFRTKGTWPRTSAL